MVEYTIHLDSVFYCLSDPIRRDILRRVSDAELSIGELAEKYDFSFAAIAKHIKVLEYAKLIRKRKEGKKYMVALVPETLKSADEYLEQYRQRWEGSFNKLDTLLREGA